VLAHFARKRIDVARRNVGRVRNDEIETVINHRFEIGKREFRSC
jgi:hypothetical protein